MTYNIKDYSKQLEQVCMNCKHIGKCKDVTRICVYKKFIFYVAQKEFKRREKEALKK